MTTHQIHILYLEPEPEIAHAVQQRFQQMDYAVDAALDGQSGLDTYAAGHYDVVIVNQMLPIHDGLEVLRILLSFGPLPPTVMVTDVPDAKTALAALNLGVSDYLVKEATEAYVELLASVVGRTLRVDGLVEERRRAVEMQRYRGQFLKLLNEMTRTALENLESPAMLKTLSERLAGALGADDCFFALWNEAAQRPFFPAVEEGAVWSVSATSFLLDPGAVPLTKAALSAKCPVIVEDVHASPYISASLAERMPAHSLLVLPLIAGDQKLGAVSVGFSGPHLFTPEEITRGEQAAHHIALAIAKARLLEETAQRYREAEMLRQVSATVTAILGLDETLDRILEQLERVVSYDCASIQLVRMPEAEEAYDDYDRSRDLKGVLEVVSGRGFPQMDDILGTSVPVPGDNPYTPVIQSRDPLLFDATQLQNFENFPEKGVKSWLGVPLIVRDEVIGLLTLNSTKAEYFGENHLRLVAPFAHQAAIAISNAQLVQALRQRTLELEMRNEELDAFAHTVAHDLKSPLTAIIGYSGVLETHLPTMPKEEMHQFLKVIAQNGNKMSNIIDEILLLATVHKLGGVEMTVLDMDSLIDGAQSRIVDLIEDRDAQFIMPETWPAVMGYGPWVEEVWANYLSNAVKYGGSRDGSVSPQVILGATVFEASEQGMVRFWVRDNGPGIPQAAQERLFTLFTRLDEVRAEGHGLGLSIVRRIVDKLGGEVGVESEPGAGSTFWFTLPTATYEKDEA